MTAIAPAILAENQAAFYERFKSLKPHFLKAQIDVVNDTIIPGQAWADAEVIDQWVGSMKFEVHLMVELENYDLEQWNRKWVEKIIVHVEAGDILDEVIKTIKSWGKQAFIAISPDTDVTQLEPYLNRVDGVMFMTIYPGRMGNPFQTDVLDVIKVFHAKHPKILIEADGGVTNETLPSLLSAGVSIVAIGSYLDSKKIEERLFEIIPIFEHYEKK